VGVTEQRKNSEGWLVGQSTQLGGRNYRIPRRGHGPRILTMGDDEKRRESRDGNSGPGGSELGIRGRGKGARPSKSRIINVAQCKEAGE